MKFVDQTGITELITLTKTALKPLESFKNSVTDVNGIVKSDGKGGFSAAAAGTDYAAASHTHTTKQIEGLSSAIADAEPFVVTIQITTSSGGGKTYTADKTYAEIKAAIDAGKCCYAITTGLEMNILFPALVSSVGVLFTATQPDSASSVVMAILSDSSIIVQTYSTQPLIKATGLLKGDGQGTISAAVAGTDYAAATHTHSYLPLSGGTLTGNLTGQYITGTWLQTTATGDKAGNFATIDEKGWVYYRTPAETLADIGAAAASHTHTTAQVKGLDAAIEEAKPFIVNITGWTFGTGDLVEDAVADKTYSEAYAAYLAGKKVVMRVNGRELSMLEASNSNMIFSLALPDAADTLNSVDMASAVWSSNGSLECGDGLIQIPLLPKTAGLLKVTNNKQIHLAVAGTDYLSPNGGTLTGPLVAQTNTSYTTAQMRNVIISTADPSGGNNGDIWLKYEA